MAFGNKSVQLAHKVDHILGSDNSRNFYLLDNLNAEQTKKFTRISNKVNNFLAGSADKYEDLPIEQRMNILQARTNQAIGALKNPAGAPCIQRIAGEYLRQLDLRVANNIPLTATTVPGMGQTFSPETALANPGGDSSGEVSGERKVLIGTTPFVATLPPGVQPLTSGTGSATQSTAPSEFGEPA